MDDENITKLRKIQGKLWALIDMNGIRGNYTYNDNLKLGNNYIADIKIINFLKEKLSNHSVVDIHNFFVSINFRKDGAKKPWFRIDNRSKDKGHPENYLHFHSNLEGKKFEEHQKIEGEFTVAEIISIAFDSAEKIILEKFPDEEISDYEFVGTV